MHSGYEHALAMLQQAWERHKSAHIATAGVDGYHGKRMSQSVSEIDNLFKELASKPDWLTRD
jgi:lysozyme family protein